MNRALTLVGLFMIGIVAATSQADEPNPSQPRAYSPQHVQLNPGYTICPVGESNQLWVHAPDSESPRLLELGSAEMTSKVFAEIRTLEQATELCELLIVGAIVPDRQTYDALLAVHVREGCKPRVKDDQLKFDRVARAANDGFVVEYTAFRLPVGMGAQSVVARYEFFVGKDASVTTKTTPYIEGLLLNWQIETEEAQKKEAEALARVQRFVEDCYKCCTTRLPAIKDKLRKD